MTATSTLISLRKNTFLTYKKLMRFTNHMCVENGVRVSMKAALLFNGFHSSGVEISVLGI
jgi:hypothetical protein